MSKLDQSHIFKAVYSEEDRAFKTVPSSSTSFSVELSCDEGDSVEIRSQAVDTLTLIDKKSANIKMISNPINILKYKNICLVADWNNCSSPTAELTLQMSLDGIIYIDTPHTILMNSNFGSKFLDLKDIGYKYVRVGIDPNSNTTGTYSVKYCLKG